MHPSARKVDSWNFSLDGVLSRSQKTCSSDPILPAFRGARLGAPADNTHRTYRALACVLTFSDRGDTQLELALAFGSIGTRSPLGLFGSLGRLLWMLYGPLLVIRLHPSIVSGLVDARSLFSFFGTFGRLLGMLRPLFAHELPPSSRLGLAVHRITVKV